MNKTVTKYLLPEFLFKFGVISSFDLSGNFYQFNCLDTVEDANFNAHLADLEAIKQNFNKSVKQLNKSFVI